MNWQNKVYCGDCREFLREMPDGCVQLVVTSPPYWAQRDYKLPPLIWDEDPNCEHEWVEFEGKKKRGNWGGNRGGWKRKSRKLHPGNEDQVSNFCLECGAWRGQLGLEPTLELYVTHLTQIFIEVRRVLNDKGTLWLVLGDTYWGSGGSVGHTYETKNLGRRTFDYGAFPTAALAQQKHDYLKPKDLCMIPFHIAHALQRDGWWLRQINIWWKRNSMPESVKDRTTTDYEFVFHFSKSKRYYYNADAIREPHKKSSLERMKAGRHSPGDGTKFTEQSNRYCSDHDCHPKGRNKRAVWDISVVSNRGNIHFAVFPEKLVEIPVLACSREGDLVMDPFCGTGTTLAVAKRLGRSYLGFDLSEKYCKFAKRRLAAIPEYLIQDGGMPL